MIELPTTTYVGKRIPKQGFYANMHLHPGERRALTIQVDSILWRNKLSADTLNIAPGEAVQELQVFELNLSEGVESCSLLDVMDCQLPYHLLFLLVKGEKVKASIAYKQAAKGGKAAFTVLARFDSDWSTREDLRLPLQGLTLDMIYEGWVRQLAGEQLPFHSGEGIAVALKRAKKGQGLAKQIAALEKRMQNEKQFNIKIELNNQLKQLRHQMTEMN